MVVIKLAAFSGEKPIISARLLPETAATAAADFRLMWSSANLIRSDDEWFPILQTALAGAFGEERAAQLLAPVA